MYGKKKVILQRDNYIKTQYDVQNRITPYFGHPAKRDS